MTSAQRVFKAINHEPVDRVPKGEWKLTDGLILALRRELGLTKRSGPRGEPEGGQEARLALVGREERAEVLELLDMDLLAFLAPPDDLAPVAQVLEEEIGWWRTHTDFFLWGVVDGPFQGTSRYFDLVDFLVRAATRDRAVLEAVPKAAQAGLEVARRYLEAGVHGIIIGDDVAYNSGTYIRPRLWREEFWPWLRFMVEELRRDNPSLPIFFHSDGDIRAILSDLVEAGFSGLHGLEASAGMDLGQLWAEYGQRICLMGNLDYQWLVSPHRIEELEDQVRGLLGMAGRGGGYIFGSSAGILDDGVRAANLVTVYRAASRYGMGQEVTRYPGHTAG